MKMKKPMSPKQDPYEKTRIILRFTPITFVLTKFLHIGANWIAGLFVSVGLLVPFGAIASGTVLDLRYEVQWGNINVGEAEASWIFTDSTFQMIGSSKTVGISDSLRKYRGTSEVTGQIYDGIHAPLKIGISGVYKDSAKNATAIWNLEDSQIHTVRAPTLDLEKVHPLDDNFIQGSIDPYTAMLRTLHTIKQTRSCASRHKVYDGLRTAELTMHDLGTQVLTGDRASAYRGKVIKCGLTIKPTGGHRLKSRWNERERKADDTVIFVAEIEPGLFLPVRIMIKTMFGKITTRLVMTNLLIRES